MTEEARSSMIAGDTQVPDLASGFDVSYRLLTERLGALTEQLHSAEEERSRELAEKERLADRLQSLLGALPAGVVVLDVQGRVQECNPAAVDLLGEPLLGELWRDVIARAFVLDAVGADLVLHDGRRVSLSTRPLGSEPGQILLLQDVTETRRLHEGLNHSQRLAEMGRMAASLAHQIRTPLASALLYVSHLKRPVLEERRRVEFAEKAGARLKDLERLITDILAFARGDAGGQEALDAGALAQEVLMGQAEALVAAGIEVKGPEAHSEAPAVLANPTLLKTALQNLVRNAIEAMSGGGRLAVNVSSPTPESVQISVADTGPGIAEPMRERIFEPFETSRSAGTGLGLAVVRAVARSHGGEAWVDSQPPHGSTFYLRLPACPTEQQKKLRVAGAGA